MWMHFFVHFLGNTEKNLFILNGTLSIQVMHDDSWPPKEFSGSTMETRFVLFRSLFLEQQRKQKPCVNEWNSVCCSWFPETLICDYQISFTNFDLRYWRQTVNKMQWPNSHFNTLRIPYNCWRWVAVQLMRELQPPWIDLDKIFFSLRTSKLFKHCNGFR